MKKIMNWMLAAILVCGATVFTSCSKADDPVTPTVDNKKCARVHVLYKITNERDNDTFFVGKFALKSGNEVKEKQRLFAVNTNGGYNVNEIAAFPVEEAVCLHYDVKDNLESYEGDYQMVREVSYEVTSYNAKGDVLDTQTISDEYTERTKGADKSDLEMTAKLSYIELHASVAEDGKITLSKVNKMHPEKSGIDW